MGHFVTDEVDRIDLGEGDWVDIKRQMSYGDDQKLVASYMNVQARVRAGEPDVDISLGTGNITLLALNIKDWNLKDESGQLMPIAETTIQRLNKSTATKLVEEINRRNPPPKV
jgi:hypothetical protein